MTYWWVNLGDTYNFVKENQFIWAPKKTKNGTTPYHWQNMLDVKRGDIIFCYSSGYLKGYSIAKDIAISYEKPFDTRIENEWENEGNRIDLEFIELVDPIELTKFNKQLFEIQNKMYSPINSALKVNQGYLYSLNNISGRFLLKILNETNNLIFNLKRTISEIKTKESILEAINEYDKLGKKAFLEKYNYKESTKYFLYYNNKLYDSKAIVGVSYKYEYPTEKYLSNVEFSGGVNTVVNLLNSFDFIVMEKSIITAVYIALKKLNREASIEEIKNEIISDNLYDFSAKDINDVIRVQIERYCDNVERNQKHEKKLFHKVETSIYTLIEFLNIGLEIKENILNTELNDLTNTFESSVEGEKKSRFTSYYERDPNLRKKAIQYHGTTCYACGFNFEEFYGEYAKDYIHIHHTKPLFEAEGEQEVDPIKDLIPVCANCHSVIHRRKNETKSLEEIKEMIKLNKLIN